MNTCIAVDTLHSRYICIKKCIYVYCNKKAVKNYQKSNSIRRNGKLLNAIYHHPKNMQLTNANVKLKS